MLSFFTIKRGIMSMSLLTNSKREHKNRANRQVHSKNIQRKIAMVHFLAKIKKFKRTAKK